MLDLISEASTLGALLEQTRGVVGVVLGTAAGELRAVVGSFADGDATAAAAAALAEELHKLGALLGLGGLGVASVKGPSATRVFARQADAVLTIELDPRRPIGELETKLQTLAWAPDPTADDPAIHRVPTVPLGERPTGQITSPEVVDVPFRPASAPPPASRTANGTAPLVRPPIGDPAPPLPAAPPALSRHAAATRPPPLPRSLRETRPPPPPGRAGSSHSAANGAAHMKAVGGGPVFTGDLEEFCLPDLLEFLRNSHRTGLLVCTTSDGIGRIQLSRGMIIGADSPNALDLREHFLASPGVGAERRRALAALPLECFSDDVIDGVLVSRDLVPRYEIEEARVARIYSAFREMMGWTVGRFSFDPGVAVVTNPALALSAQSILMHLYQEQDEQGR